jgi:hypothetical protein
MNTIKHLQEPIGWLTTFKIEVASSVPFLYNNGRQQVAVLLTVEPAELQEVTPEQFDTLTVVEYTDDGKFIELPTTPREGDWWTSSEKNKFDYFSEAVTQYNNFETKETSRKYFYIMTDSTSGTLKRLRVRINKTPELVYHSVESPIGQIELTSMSVRRFSSPEDYNFERVTLEGDQATGNVVYKYSLTPKGLRFVNDSKAGAVARMDPNGMIKWADMTPSETYASHVSNAGVDLADVVFNQDIYDALPAEFIERMVKTVEHTNEGAFLILLQGDRAIPYVSDIAINQRGPCQIVAYDNQGTQHVLSVSFPSAPTERFELVLT